jgi:hypothetical protein
VHNALLLIAVGSTVTNPSDLRFLYEGHVDFSALPTFLVVQGVSAVMETSITASAFGDRDVNPAKVSQISIFQQMNSLVAEPEGSTPLIPKPATGYDPEPVPSISHPP